MKSSWRVCVLGLLGLAAVCQLAAAAPAAQAFTERSPGHFDAAAYTLEMQLLNSGLVAEGVPAAMRAPIAVKVTQAELDDLEAGAFVERRVRVGLTKDVGVAVDFADLGTGLQTRVAQLRPFGAVQGSPAAGFVWTGVVRSEKATALRLHFTELNLPEGVELFVYNLAGDAFGPYTGKGPMGTGELWSHTVTGPEIFVQLHAGRALNAPTLRATHFVIDELGFLGERFLLPFYTRPASGSLAERAFCSFNASCVQNVNCGGTSSAVNGARDAVAHMQFRSGGFIYICSGGLLADTDSSSQIPYFLTANHCLSKNRDASSLEAYFQFDTPCGGSCYDPVGAVPRTVGSTVVATNRTGDYTLLELAETPPAGSAFLGWNSTPVAFSNGTNLYRVSHPLGAPQAYSEHQVDTSKVTCTSWPRGERIYSQDLYGATEGGSSGSPVVNSAGQVVGQLSGACGYNVNDPCDSASNATVDGAFASYFSEVEPYLDPGSGGGTCAPTGDPCKKAADCCSGVCSGQGKNKTCG